MSKACSGPSSRSLLKLKHAREKLDDLVSGNDYSRLFSTVKLLECFDDGSAKFQWTVEEWQLNQRGSLHGGYITSILAFATNTGLCLANIEDYVSADINVSFLSTTKEGDLVTIETRVISRGPILSSARARLILDSGKLIATATSSLRKLSSESCPLLCGSLRLRSSIKNMVPLQDAQEMFSERLPDQGFRTFLLSADHLKSCSSEGDMSFQWTVSGAQLNRFKQVNIGYIAAVFDMVSYMGVVLFDKSRDAVSVDLSLNCHIPCFEGEVLMMQTNILKNGQTLAFVEGVIVNDNEEIVATAKQTLMRVLRKPAAYSQHMISSKM